LETTECVATGFVCGVLRRFSYRVGPLRLACEVRFRVYTPSSGGVLMREGCLLAFFGEFSSEFFSGGNMAARVRVLTQTVSAG